MLDAKLRQFEAFQWLVWKRLLGVAPTPLQRDMARYVALGPDPTVSPFSPPNNKVFLGGFRGAAKSWTSCGLADYYLAQDEVTLGNGQKIAGKDMHILVIAGGQDKATENTTFMQKILLECPELNHLVPRGQRVRWSRESFDVEGARAAAQPSVKSRSITGMLVGNRAHAIILDDIETPQNSDTVQQREKIERFAAEAENILLPGGRIIVLGTFQSEESYYTTLKDKGFSMRLWPSRYVTPEINEKNYSGWVAPALMADVRDDPSIVGHSTEPTRFDDDELRRRELSMGRSMFALQMELDPSLSDERRYPLKLRDLMVTDVDTKVAPEHLVWASGKQNRIDLPNSGFSGDGWYEPMQAVGKWRPYTAGCMFIDPSGRGIDETVAITGNVLNSLVYVKSLYTSILGYEEDVLEDIAKLALRDNIGMIQYEDNFGDGMFGQLLRPVVRRVFTRAHSKILPAIEGIRHSQQKEKRIIAALEPVMNAHRLVMNRSIVDLDMETIDRARRMFYQLTHLTKVKGCLKHDDRLDCLAGLVRYFSDAGMLSTDHREAIRNSEEEEEREDYAMMMRDLGRHVSSPNMLSSHRVFRS